jgi:hypothetical protein
MNSSPVLDLAPRLAANTETASPASPEMGEAPDQSFGVLLEQVDAKITPPIAIEIVEPELELEAPLPEEPTDKTDDQKKSALINIAPFICFALPPEIPSTPLAPPPAANPPVEALSAKAPEPSELSPTPDIVQPQSSLKEIVEPKKAKKEKESGKIKLDPAVFEAVKESSLDTNPTHISKAPPVHPDLPDNKQHTDVPEVPIVTARHNAGTPAAQQGNAMKNAQKTAENAPVIEQKMPVREVSRRPAVTRLDTSSISAAPRAELKTDFQTDTAFELAPVKPLDTVHVVESIRTEVAQLRMRNDSNVTVVLRPDNGTELQIDISISRDGSVHAQARCERGDVQSLNAHWPQLQQSLAAHGVQMTNLSNPGNSHQNSRNPDSSNFQTSDRGNNSQQRNPQQSRAFEDELAASTPRFPTQKTFNRPTANTPSRRWQSWA